MTGFSNVLRKPRNFVPGEIVIHDGIPVGGVPVGEEFPLVIFLSVGNPKTVLSWDNTGELSTEVEYLELRYDNLEHIEDNVNSGWFTSLYKPE